MFFKPVRSRTRFWQMVGRGTRLCPDLFGPRQDKQCFWIFDLCQNLEFFLNRSGSDGASPPATLSTRLFRSRLQLIDTIDSLPQQQPLQQQGTGLDPAILEHRQALAELLRRHVAACPADSFLVRPHLEQVERFREPQAWQSLSAEDHQLLSTLAPLPSAQAEQDGDTDAEARRFDLLLYSLQLARLRGEPRFARLQQQLQELAAQLEGKANMPQVAAELDLIQDLLCSEWWEDLTAPMLEEVRRRLRSLVCFIERSSQTILYTNFSDELGELQELDAASLLTPDAMRQFRLRAAAFLREHEDHLTMQRLRRNFPHEDSTAGQTRR